MAAILFLGEPDKDGLAPIIVRVQSKKYKTQVRQKIGLSIAPRIWEQRKDDRVMRKYNSNEVVMKAVRDAEEIRLTINEKMDNDVILDKDMVREIINSVVYRKQRENEAALREAERLAEEESKRMTLNKYIRQYIHQIETGARQTDKGVNYSPNTVKAVKTAMKQWEEFQKHVGREYDFKDIDIQVYYDYTAWLKTEFRNRKGEVTKAAYSVNSIGKCISNLKVILEAARSDKYHNVTEYTDKKFKSTRVEVDSIYLPKEDLDRLMAVDCSKVLSLCKAADNDDPDFRVIEDKENGKGYELARDIFMVGVWTAQRVSDYNNISKDQIETFTRKFIAQEPDPANPSRMIDVVKSEEMTVINIRQQKTKAKVSIPCSTVLLQILEKYNFQLPHLADQTVNDYIKMVAKAAGMTEKVEIMTTKGGTPKREFIPKYKLIHTHTARRTGATLMYLAGMDIYDIMKITGHTSPTTLKKYIKANELEVVSKIKDKYNYFD